MSTFQILSTHPERRHQIAQGGVFDLRVFGRDIQI